MASETKNARPWLAALLGLVAGLIIGLIIAWGLWPVSYKNALPQDLRSAERDQYLALVATSLVATGDAQAAYERLQTWPSDDLATTLTNLQERLATTDPATAAAVEQLASTLNLSAAIPSARPGASSGARPAGSAPAWQTLCMSALWIALILIGLAALVFLFRQWRAARARRTTPAITGVPQAAPRTPDEIAEREKEEWTVEPADQPAVSRSPITDESESYFYEEDEADDFNAAPAAVVATQVARPPAQPAAPSVAPTPEASHRAPAAAAAAVVAAGAKPSGAPVGDFMAVYQMGEADYDEAFDINDPNDGYMGQCGLQLNEPVGRNHDQAVALQAWLWDSSDPDTRTKVLMSEAAYRDTALRSQLAGQHEAVQVKAGTEFELESHDLLLRGRVEKADFIDQESNRGIFAELQVRMVIYRRA
jgi:hypothetical protein